MATEATHKPRANEASSEATATATVQLHPDAVALHYQASAAFWEQHALAVQHKLVLIAAERDRLADELERLKNPPVVTNKPQGQV